MEWIADDGTTIYYELYGDERLPALLLLPGLLGTISRQWQPFVQPLSAHFRLLLLDLRGHGRSTNNATDLRPDRMVQDVVGLVDGLGLTAVSLSGYDFGGYLALQFALTQPRRVTTLHLHATKFYWTDETASQMRQQLDPETLVTTAPSYADQLVIDHGSRRWRDLLRQSAALIAQQASSGIREQQLQQLPCPALVSVGDRDEMVSLPETYRLSRAFRRGGLFVLPGVHHPIHNLTLVPMLPMLQTFHKNK
ncbi:MAG: alpha/beta fold hydrolase [Anaerolineales bacterium]|nr:alpha/beta fold hydrolase [Anaerolineales bacterium]